MKTMCPPQLSTHHNDFVATHTPGHMMYGFIIVVITGRVHYLVAWFHVYLYKDKNIKILTIKILTIDIKTKYLNT